MGFFRSLFGSEPIPAKPLPPISLASEAETALGFHDITRAAAIANIRDIRAELAANIEAETKALAALDEHLAREERAYGAPDLAPSGVHVPDGAVLVAASGEVTLGGPDDPVQPVADLMPVVLAPTASRKAKRPAPELEAAE